MAFWLIGCFRIYRAGFVAGHLLLEVLAAGDAAMLAGRCKSSRWLSGGWWSFQQLPQLCFAGTFKRRITATSGWEIIKWHAYRPPVTGNSRSCWWQKRRIHNAHLIRVKAA
ncbi:hypothetical protein IE982_06490 [Enterobacter hormaechei]|nr:hypothetical protein [Enterobacter hormaechei]